MVCHFDDERTYACDVNDGDSCSQPAWSYGRSLTDVSPVEYHYNGV
jgi:hypothetical protein